MKSANTLSTFCILSLIAFGPVIYEESGSLDASAYNRGSDLACSEASPISRDEACERLEATRSRSRLSVGQHNEVLALSLVNRVELLQRHNVFWGYISVKLIRIALVPYIFLLIISLATDSAIPTSHNI